MGGFGREALYLALDINKIGTKWNIMGYIDDNPGALEDTQCAYSIVGTISDWELQENQVFALGISSPKIKEKISFLLKSKGARIP